MTTSSAPSAGPSTATAKPAWSGTWTWTFEDAAGAAAEGGPQQPDGGFSAQADAETWVGQQWRALVEAGAEGALLHRDGERVYGPVPLRPLA